MSNWTYQDFLNAIVNEFEKTPDNDKDPVGTMTKIAMEYTSIEGIDLEEMVEECLCLAAARRGT